MFFSQAKEKTEQVKKSRQEMRDFKGSPSGHVVVGSPHVAGTLIVAKLVTIFKERFPKASLEIIDVKRSVGEWIELGRIDIGILYDPVPSPAIEIIPLKVEELFLVSSISNTKLRSSQSVPVSQLGKYPLILPGKHHPVRTLVEAVTAKVGVRLNVVLEAAGGSLLLELVHRGHGHTLLLKRSVSESHLANHLQ